MKPFGRGNKKMKTIEEKKQLIINYMSECPFIEFHDIVELNEETATIDVAFDHNFEEVKEQKDEQ